MMRWGVLPKEEAVTSNMNYCHKATYRLIKMKVIKLLMLGWCSYSGCGREHLAAVVCPTGSRSLSYECPQPIASEIAHDWTSRQDNWNVVWSLFHMTDILTFCVGQRGSNTGTAPPENERERSVINWMLSILGYVGGNLLQLFIYEVLAACSGNTLQDLLVTPLWQWA